MCLASGTAQHQGYLQILVCSECLVRPYWWGSPFITELLDKLTCIVIVLPLFMVWGLQLRTSQKVVLAGIFSLAFVVAVFDILRTVESLESGTFSGVALWSSLEVTIAVIVASLPLYRVLLTNKGRKSLLSHTSLLGRYKDMSDSQTAVERKSSDDRSSRRKPSVNTFRDDLETQNLTPPIRGERGQQFPLAHLPH